MHTMPKLKGVSNETIHAIKLYTRLRWLNFTRMKIKGLYVQLSSMEIKSFSTVKF